MSMPRIKLLVLSDGNTIWFPNEGDIQYYDNIKSIWIEEELTPAEFKELSKNRVFLKNRR